LDRSSVVGRLLHPHRSKIMVNLAALYQSQDEKAKHEASVSEFAKPLSRVTRAAYVNFLGEADEAQVRAAYLGSTWDRLRRSRPSTIRPTCSA